MCWKHPCGDKILHLVTRSLIQYDYSHLMTDKSSENMTVLYETRTRIAFKHGTAWSDADNSQAVLRLSPNLAVERPFATPRWHGCFSFHCILSYTHVCRAMAGTSGPISTEPLPQPPVFALIPLVPSYFRNRTLH